MGQEKQEAGQHDVVSSLTVQWEPVSRLSPGEAMAMVMALSAQQWQRRGGERGNHSSGRVVVMGLRRGELERERSCAVSGEVVLVSHWV